jgi:hypothetical protein
MTRYYMTNTPLAAIEVMMMYPPGFKPRGSGMLSRHRYTAADCDCRYCHRTEKKKKPCAGAAKCVCFDDRLTAGCWTHGELVECLIKEIAVRKLTERTRRLLPPQTTTLFIDEAHLMQTSTIAAAVPRESTPYTAAAFLLSADPILRRKARQALQNGSIDFGKVDTRGLSLDGYTLLQTAKDLYLGGCRLTPDDLCDPQLIGDELFRLIISAFVIRRYGLPANIL